MKVALVNLPWAVEGRLELWGVRAGSRWPHLQRRAAPGELPRYVPFPFMMAIAASAAAEGGHETLLLDAVAENLSFAAAAARVFDFAPDLLFAEVSTPSLHEDMRLLRKLRESLPGTVFACGGSHSPKLAAQAMKHEGLPDYWIAGEYERALSSLASALESGRDGSTLKGVVKAGSDFESFASAGDLDSLPSPDYASLPMKSYSDPVCGLPAPGAQTWLSRGCPFKCSFCVWPQILYGGHECRARSADIALDEVQRLIDGFGCESYYFDDDTGNFGERRMEELASRIIARGLHKWPWAMMARADCMSKSMIQSLASAGMYAVKYGVESFSPKLIDACGKATRLDKLHEALDNTRSLGVKMHLTFTFGLPGETVESVRETVDEAIRAAPESAQFSICTPFPGTRFYDECVERGWLVTDDWSRFLGSGEDVVVSTPELSAQALKEAYEEALAKWRSFQDARMERRKARLVAELSKASAQGARWHLEGEASFASFLAEAGLKPNASSLESADLVAVVSRHDEERIARRLGRNPALSGKPLARLFHD